MVLAAKPDSLVKVLTDGSVPLTAFIPNDRAFALVHDLSGKRYSSEKTVFNKLVAAVGVVTPSRASCCITWCPGRPSWPRTR
ncbi:MAG: hypothetical protein R2703_07385 [Micropruina glycogenica]